jgi:hypothetical protein
VAARGCGHRPEPFGADELLKEMNAAALDAVIIVSRGWEGDRTISACGQLICIRRASL